MPKKKLPPINEHQWLDAVEAYELGQKSQRQIARELGVSAATVCRQMRTRGAVKASRIDEVIDELNARLDHHALLRIQADAAAWKVKMLRVEKTNAMISNMMQAIIMADKLGNIAMAKGVIAATSAAI